MSSFDPPFFFFPFSHGHCPYHNNLHCAVTCANSLSYHAYSYQLSCSSYRFMGKINKNVIKIKILFGKHRIGLSLGPSKLHLQLLNFVAQLPTRLRRPQVWLVIDGRHLPNYVVVSHHFIKTSDGSMVPQFILVDGILIFPLTMFICKGFAKLFLYPSKLRSN